MMRSMFSGISGLRSHQTMMDVVGNNIANVNTPGYKAMRAAFQESLTQVTRGGTAGQPAQGGMNPMQLGLGTRVGSIDGMFGQGAVQVTGRTTDLAIQGAGFFQVDVGGGEIRYSRAGNFSFDSLGQLVGPGGEQVVVNDPAGNRLAAVDFGRYTGVTINNLGEVLGRDGLATLPNGDPNPGYGGQVSIGRIQMASFVNLNGLERTGGSLFMATEASGPPTFGVAGDAAIGTIQAGTLEMSNVDLAQEFTNLILAQRGFQANSRTITSSDEMLQDLVNLKR